MINELVNLFIIVKMIIFIKIMFVWENCLVFIIIYFIFLFVFINLVIISLSYVIFKDNWILSKILGRVVGKMSFVICFYLLNCRICVILNNFELMLWMFKYVLI